MARHLSFVVAPLLWLVTATTLCAAADPLSVVPDDALGLVVVNNLSDLSARVQKLTQKMQLPVPELLPMAQLYLGIQQGLDEKGGIAAAAFPDSEDADWGMSLAVFVPVTNYKAFVGQLQPEDGDAAIASVNVMGQKYLVANKEGFAVFAPESAKSTLERILAAKQHVAAGLAPLRPWLSEQQVAIVLTPAGKKMLFAKVNSLIKTGTESLEAVKKQAADQKKDDKDADDKDAETSGDAVAQLQSFQQMLDAVRELFASSESELTQLGVGIRIDDSAALHLSTRVLFAAEGKFAKFGKTVVVPERGLLAGLPAGKFVVAYGGVSVPGESALAKLVDRLGTMGMEQLGVSPELNKKYLDVMARLRANQLNSCGLLGQMRAGDSILASAVSIDYVRNAKEHIKISREMYEILQSAVPKRGHTKLPTYEIKDVMIGDLKALEISTDLSSLWGGAEGDAAVPQQFMQSFFSKLFGDGGVIRAYVAEANERTVVSAYTKEQLQRAVEHLRAGSSGLEKDEQIANTTALLPKDAQWAGYVSPRGLLEMIDTILRQALPEGMNFRIPAFPPTDPIGFGAKVAESGLDAEIVLPDSVVAGIGQYVVLVQQMFQQNAAPLP